MAEDRDAVLLNSPRADVYSTIFSVLMLILLFSFVVKPGLSWTTISTDFRWKRNLISYYTAMRLKLGDRVYNQTLVGKNGWFFFTGNFSVEDYQKLMKYNPGRLSKIQTGLDRLNADLKSRGITLLVVVVPEKSTIYPQYMPDGLPVVDGKSRLDQFLDYMRLNGNTEILDLRPTLLRAGRSQMIYYKTDTHWNALGAFYAYKQVMNALSSSNMSLTPHSLSNYQYVEAGNSMRDLPLLMGLLNYPEENWTLTPFVAPKLEASRTLLPDGRYIRTITNADTKLPTLLVFHDSFYDALAQFIEPHFSKVKTIPFTYEKGVWSLDWIQREKPDFVIIEVAERVVDVSLPLLLIK